MSKDATTLLVEWNDGDKGALEELEPLIYAELRRLVEQWLDRENAGHTLQPAALINEAYRGLIDQTRVGQRDRASFAAIAAPVMRRLVVDLASGDRRAKRQGDGAARVTLDEALLGPTPSSREVVALDEALQELQAIDPRQSKIVELRVFGGLSRSEIAEVLGVSENTVKRELRTALLWLRREMAEGAD